MRLCALGKRITYSTQAAQPSGALGITHVFTELPRTAALPLRLPPATVSFAFAAAKSSWDSTARHQGRRAHPWATRPLSARAGRLGVRRNGSAGGPGPADRPRLRPKPRPRSRLRQSAAGRGRRAAEREPGGRRAAAGAHLGGRAGPVPAGGGRTAPLWIPSGRGGSVSFAADRERGRGKGRARAGARESHPPPRPVTCFRRAALVGRAPQPDHAAFGSRAGLSGAGGVARAASRGRGSAQAPGERVRGLCAGVRDALCLEAVQG